MSLTLISDLLGVLDELSGEVQPSSFAREAFFAVTSFRLISTNGVSRHGRFRVLPEEGTELLSNEQAAAKSTSFLFDEIGQRLAKGPIRLSVSVQLAGDGDDITDSSVPWAGYPPADPLRYHHPGRAREQHSAGDAQDHL